LGFFFASLVPVCNFVKLHDISCCWRKRSWFCKGIQQWGEYLCEVVN